MKYTTLEGLSLTAIPYGESHRIVRFFSRDLGKIAVMAHGARKQLSKFALVSEPATHSTLVLAHNPRSDLFTLKEAEVLQSFIAIKQQYHDLQAIFAFVGMLNDVTGESDSDSYLFDSIIALLRGYNAGSISNGLFHVLFRMAGLRLLGRKPDWTTCSLCGRQSSSLTVLHGQVQCLVCGETQPGIVIREAVLEIFRCVDDGTLHDFSALNAHPALPDAQQTLQTLLHQNILDKSRKKGHFEQHGQRHCT